MRRRDLRAGAAATAAAAQKPPAETAAPGATGTTALEAAGNTPALRDQPFTLTHWAATLPDRDPTPEEASGPLSHDEHLQLIECHRAIDNARAAQWMLGRALEIVRRRRLYRGDGSRTWLQYLEAEHDGMTEREARRLQDEWRLSYAVQEAWGRPAPASHVRAMLEYANSTSDEEAAHAYAMLRNAFGDAQVRVAARQITARVTKALESAATVEDPHRRREAVAARWGEVHAPHSVIPAPSNGQGPQQPPTLQGGDPLVAAVRAAEQALERVDDALMNRRATQQRSAVDAEHLQSRIRRVGRVLAKATVPAADVDDVIDAELVEEPHG